MVVLLFLPFSFLQHERQRDEAMGCPGPNGESEEMMGCVDEGERDEARGCPGPSHTLREYHTEVCTSGIQESGGPPFQTI